MLSDTIFKMKACLLSYSGAVIVSVSLFCVSAVDNAYAVSAGPPNLRATGIHGVYLYEQRFMQTWFRLFNESIYNRDSDKLWSAVRDVVKDVKSMGFNSIIISSRRMNLSSNVSYKRLISLLNWAGKRYGVSVIVMFPYTASNRRLSCGSSQTNRFLVSSFAKASAVQGYYCAFELWVRVRRGQTNVNFKSIRTIKERMNVAGKFSYNIAAGGSYPTCFMCNYPTTTSLFDVVTPTLSPLQYPTQITMNAAVKKFAGYGGFIRKKTGVLMQLKFFNKKIPDTIRSYRAYTKRQRNAILRYRPFNAVAHMWQPLILERDRAGHSLYKPRGVLMNINEKLENRFLYLYDPMESDYASQIIGAHLNRVSYTSAGGGNDWVISRRGNAGSATRIGGRAILVETRGGRAGILWYPPTDRGTRRLNINKDVGTVQFWLKPKWRGNDGKRHILFATKCFRGAKNCIIVEKTSRGVLLFRIYPSVGKYTFVKADVSGLAANQWRHIAVSWNKRRGLNLYIDGRIVQSRRKSWGMTNISFISVGGYFGRFTADSYIDDLKIYGYKLSSAQILANKNHFIDIRNKP